MVVGTDAIKRVERNDRDKDNLDLANLRIDLRDFEDAKNL
jgi:hypothetical protein